MFKSSIRAVDFVARYGGEEFVFIFERTTADEAFVVLEEINKMVAETEFYYRDTPVDLAQKTYYYTYDWTLNDVKFMGNSSNFTANSSFRYVTVSWLSMAAIRS